MGKKAGLWRYFEFIDGWVERWILMWMDGKGVDGGEGGVRSVSG